MEIWKDIIGFEDLYQVSNCGVVRHKKFNHILKPRDNRGYKVVVLCKNNKHYNKSVHRLVAGAFIPNPENLPCVNHKNEVKDDNRVENLEWCDVKYNTNYGTGIKRMMETRVKNGYIDKSHIGLSHNEINRIYKEKIRRKRLGL